MENYKKSIVNAAINKLVADLESNESDYWSKEVKAINSNQDIEAKVCHLIAKVYQEVNARVSIMKLQITRKHNIENKNIRK